MLGARNYRKRPLFRAPSPNRDSPGSNASKFSRASGVSGFSKYGDRRKSIASRRSYVSTRTIEGLGAAEGKHLKAREWLILLIEMFLAFASYVINERNNTVEELIRVGRTRRQNSIHMLYWQGWAAFGAMLTGYLADSYIGHYTISCFSVVIHFAAMSIIFMEHTIKGNQKRNLYAHSVWNIAAAANFLLKSTEFTRMVYGLAGMGNRRRSTKILFIFMVTWIGDKAIYGGPIVNLTKRFEDTVFIRMSFVASGVCLFLFLYVLRPEDTSKENWGIGHRVVRCIIIASIHKWIRGSKGEKSWLSQAESRCDRATIGKTRDLLMLYAVLFPAIGFIFFVTVKVDIFCDGFMDIVRPSGLFYMYGIPETIQLIVALSMLVTYFGLWPLLSYVGMKRSLSQKFLLGYIFALAAMYYYSFSLRSVELLQLDSSTGYVRVFNARQEQVEMISQDRTFSTLDYNISSLGASMVAYPAHASTLFEMTIKFNGSSPTNFTLFLSVTPDQTTGYLVLDPPEIVRIRGVLPIREGPPGTNVAQHPRVFLFNAAKTLRKAKFRVRKAGERTILREMSVPAGQMKIFQLPVGKYAFRIPEADIEKTVELDYGGIYGVFSYADTSSRHIAFDNVKPSNQASANLFIPFSVLYGVANGLALVALRAITFLAAPTGLVGMSFGYLSFLEHISAFIFYAGSLTWHYFVTAQTVLAYSFCVTISFFVSTFVLIKYKDVHYV